MDRGRETWMWAVGCQPLRPQSKVMVRLTLNTGPGKESSLYYRPVMEQLSVVVIMKKAQGETQSFVCLSLPICPALSLQGKTGLWSLGQASGGKMSLLTIC